MYDPDALYLPTCRHLTPEERDAKQAEMLDRHRRWQERNAPIQARDARWRRRWQVVLGVLVLATAVLVGSILWDIRAWLMGDSHALLDGMVSHVKIGTVATTLTVIRMMAAWRKRRSASTVARTADAIVSVLPGR